MSSVDNFAARVVVTAENGGRSYVADDYDSRTRADTPTFAVADVWASQQVPTTVDAPDFLNGTVQLDPPQNGILVRIVALPPDSEWKGTDAFKAAIEAVGGSEEDGGDGFHATDTVDIITVISGEMYAVLDDGEVLLKAGDTLIQRGTRHAWSNRSDAPAVFTGTMIPATR